MMDQCAHCGYNEFYKKTKISGTVEWLYKFDGSLADNTGILDNLDYKSSKTSYCAQCHKPFRNLIIGD